MASGSSGRVVPGASGSQAGGAASNGFCRILDVQPHALHERTPLFIGSRDEVAVANELIQSGSACAPDDVVMPVGR